MKKTIIDFIKRNRVSTTELADCMGKKGALKHVAPITKGQFVVGSLFYVYAYGGTNWDVHRQLEKVEDNDIVYIEALNKKDKAIFGDLVAKYLILYRQVNAIVTNGLLRDAPRLIKEKWPIWCRGFSPLGYSNEQTQLTKEAEELIQKRQKKYSGAIIVCDDTGVIVIPKKYHTKKFLKKIKEIEEQEDAWFDAIDTQKLSTFQTVCLQKHKKKGL